MRSVRLHHDPAPRNDAHRDRSGAAPGHGRLNLLLSYAGWRPEPWVDRLPRLLEPMGVHSLTAQSGREASEVIRRNRIHIAVVDLGLPLEACQSEAAGAGCRLLEILRRLDAPPPTVVVKRPRSTRDEQRELSGALRAGAFAVIDRPHDTGDLELLLEVLRRVLARHYAGAWPGGRPA
ncbi:MAG: hypothetical protein ACIARR_06435 [Phycisphaerales bacterium JB059]